MNLKNWRQPKTQKSSLNHRFIAAVLTPPFVVLLCLGIVIIWQLNGFVRDQAVSELNRAAVTTSAKLEREFALRQTILKRTGEELFVAKSQYQTALKDLDEDRSACSAHLKLKKDFRTAPDNVCKPFLADFADKGVGQVAVEEGYIRVGQELSKNQKTQINERLSSFGQFFPETVVLLVADKDGAIVSSALSDAFKGSADTFNDYLKTAKTTPIEGAVLNAHNFRLAVFAYPIASGSVLAAYDLSSDSFLRDSWESTPIDRSRALAVILDSDGKLAYPAAGPDEEFKSANQSLRNRPFTTLDLSNISHIATAAPADGSKWLVAVASPRTVVLSPVRDAQIIAVVIVGVLLVGFLWVGTYFIQRTLQSILRLVSGSVVFAGGNLDYKIQLDSGDQEFIALAATMNKMAGRIATAEKELDEKNKEFISIATHELRTPLTAIKGNLSMAYEDMGDQLPDALKPLVAEAFNGTTRLATLVNDMLDMARLDGNRVEFVIERQDIGAMAQEVVQTLQVTAAEKPVSLTYDHTGAQPVMADATKLRIVLNNFVSNAIKYNRPSGSVKLSHSLQDGLLVTAIADTGLGIPEAQKAHMFEKFFRVQNDDRKDIIGTGLGMYITREYVLKMGGKVWFESTHGQGTTFYFSLPLASAPPSQPSVSVTTLPLSK